MSGAPPHRLGRGVVLLAGSTPPKPWADAAVVRIDEPALLAPGGVVARLYDAWSRRGEVVVELAVDPARFRTPESIGGEPWMHTPLTEPWFDRLHFLVWANNYDLRSGEPVWWWSTKACRVAEGAVVIAPSHDAPGDVLLADGRAVWVDGGPRRPATGGELLVHAESVELGVCALVPPARPPTDDLAADQLAAVAHDSGAARIVAPAGSGKTRVLTARLRHLVGDRGVETGTVLAVAYNKQAQLEMEQRTRDVAEAAGSVPIRTLNALGLWVLTRHRGRPPALFEERDVRRLVESLLPGRRARRANVDPIGPYLEGLASVRLGLRDPDEVEASRDDVPGLVELFPAYRAALAERGAVDFDEQVYGAVEALLTDGVFRRDVQRSCRHLLVDEFQDLTPAHVMLLRLLALPELDVFGVGDDDQCIYGHAGADPAFLIEYDTLFPGAGQHALHVNHRCPVAVVDAASTLLGYNVRRIPKSIVAGPTNDDAEGALAIREHAPDDSARALAETVQGWLADPTVEPSSIAVLARVNSLLLAPHVGLHAAGVPIASVLTPDVLTRTGLRAALAYLRIATNPGGFDHRDVVEILRRPTRGLPQWFPERLARRATWTVAAIAGLADRVGDKDAPKVLALADDLRLLVDAGRRATTRELLEVVRDDVGLGAAMSLLDQSGSGQGSSHLDDLDGLLGVADLHPDAATFEQWLREAFQREAAPGGVTLSTIHRVKGREWDHVAVFGVSDGIMPHRLADDVEEERRVLHVAITRGRHRVAVLADRSRRSPFLDELAGQAPHRPAPHRRDVRPQPLATSKPARRATPDVMAVELSGPYADAERALRDWRRMRASADGVPAYVVLNDRYLRGIAIAQPASPAELLACDGIGPTKLENYGEQILAVLASLTS